jgi:hypothetical protein
MCLGRNISWMEISKLIPTPFRSILGLLSSRGFGRRYACKSPYSETPATICVSFDVADQGTGGSRSRKALSSSDLDRRHEASSDNHEGLKRTANITECYARESCRDRLKMGHTNTANGPLHQYLSPMVFHN